MAEPKMQLEDWLDDLCVRFIIHLPKEDLSSVARICFQVEEAQWFYEDFIRPLDPTLPSMSLRSFCLRIFQHCPLLAPFSAENHMRAFDEFMQYKTRVPVRGAILLNEAMDSTVLVKGWKKGANWSFPRGKINKDEDDLDCAIREVYEETGFDIRQAGLVPKADEVKYIQISMREQQIRLYVFRNIPMDTAFEPKTRKEISKVEWYKLSELPAFRKKGNNSHDDAAAASNANKFYMVAPFLVPLKKWVVQQKKKDAARAAVNNPQLAIQAQVEEPLTEDDIGTQTEPVPPPSNGRPAIETLEGATRELQRLLKVRPPTQGLQQTSSAASNAGKGEALMALLQRGADMPTQNPHTPLDLTYTNAPEPHSPHHHHIAQRLPVHDHQPPPNFPLPPSSVQNAAPGYHERSRASAQVPTHVYGQNQFMNSPQQHRNEPVLLHPQPLPPQVQQSILTRDIIPTPGLPDTAGQDGQYVQRAGPHPQSSGQHFQQGPPNQSNTHLNSAYASQQQAGKPKQLTGHAMTLLNTFKSGSRDSAENKAPGDNTQENASLQARNQHQYQEPPWTNVLVTHASNPAAPYLPQHMVYGAPLRVSPRTMQHAEAQPGHKHVQPSDSHRTALLDIFKKSGPKSPLSNEIRMQAGATQESPSFGRRNDPGSPAYKAPSAAETIASASEANGTPVRINPEVSLPYRAVQILSRPKQAEPEKLQDYASTQVQMQRLQQRVGPQESRTTGRQGLPSPRERSFLQQMEQEAKRSPQLTYAAAQAAGAPYAKQSPFNTHPAQLSQHHQQYFQQPTSMLQRRKDSNPEQRQKLLSLFSKEQQQEQQQQQQPSSAVKGFSAEEKAKGKEPAGMYDQHQQLPDTPRSSRVASFASAGGNEPATGSGSAAADGSRRGSQTPISPADRSFLLSYLESVSNVGR
ncbi:hypothetical protein N657DRAFT_645598 [Parathielavia appendiculata]|uniref:Nudix hydrolase domain-containing protein n=1 Tax=Parathielavia appendiculata TaxID=2587402 RepID=A0AAN6Z3T9_9PEZI|nr:hypothetical protein N657DRAFT_645598 [Parathielavia appendiculata]